MANKRKKPDASKISDDIEEDMDAEPARVGVQLSEAPEAGEGPEPATAPLSEWGQMESESNKFGEDDEVTLDADELEKLAVGTDPQRLSEELSRIAERIALEAKRVARASAALLSASSHLKRAESLLEEEYRERLTLGGKPPTIAATNAAVGRDSRIAKARGQVNRLTELKENRWAILEGLRAKKDALVAIAKIAVAEMTVSPGVFGPKS